MNVRVYTIIVTYNAMNWIKRCLDSLQQSELSTSVVIVDNASTDKTIPFIKQYYPSVHIISNEVNQGFGTANNQGIEYAYLNGATHFFLCNQDVYIKKDTIKNLVEVQDMYNIAVVSPIHFNGAFSLLDQSFFSSFVIDEINNLFVSSALNKSFNDYYCTRFVNAAAWIINRETIESIGGFDPIFPHYGEDANYVNRIHFHKKHIAIIPSAQIAHDRIFKGNIKVFNKYSLLSSILYEYSRLEVKISSLSINRLKLIFILFRNILKNLFLLRFKYFKESFFVLSYITKNIKTLIAHRKQNMTITSNWLNI